MNNLQHALKHDLNVSSMLIFLLWSVHPLRTDVQVDIMDSFVLIDVGIRGTGKVVKAHAAAFRRFVITLKDADSCVRDKFHIK